MHLRLQYSVGSIVPEERIRDSTVHINDITRGRCFPAPHGYFIDLFEYIFPKSSIVIIETVFQKGLYMRNSEAIYVSFVISIL